MPAYGSPGRSEGAGQEVWPSVTPTPPPTPPSPKSPRVRGSSSLHGPLRAESWAQWPLSSLRPVSCGPWSPVAVPSFRPAVSRLLTFGKNGHFHSSSRKIGNGLENMATWNNGLRRPRSG